MPRKQVFTERPGIRPGFPEWRVFANRFTCPSCHNYFDADRAKLRDASHYETRPCPFCWKTALLPREFQP